MIIPVKCFTCGKVLADKYLYYLRKVKEEKLKDKKGCNVNDVSYLNLKEGDSVEKTIEGKIMDKLHLTKMCCRRHVLTHVDII